MRTKSLMRYKEQYNMIETTWELQLTILNVFIGGLITGATFTWFHYREKEGK